MVTESRDESAALTPDPLWDELHQRPGGFEFFQAVRLLAALEPDRAQVGGFGNPEDEVVRFAVPPKIGFPVSEIESLQARRGAPAHMTVNFMGLTGPLGVLPYYYTLEAADRVRHGDKALQAFLDIFHHRIISLFYRAWEKYRFEQSPSATHDKLTEHLLDLVGLGDQATQQTSLLRDATFVFYSGLLGPHQRSAAALQQILEDYFEIPAEVQEFVGAWYPIVDEVQCGVGADEGLSNMLGGGAVVGDEVWDQQARVRIRLGPLTREQYDDFLPGNRGHRALSALTSFFGQGSLDFEIQLVLAKDDVPGCVLGVEDTPGPLGWSTWIRTTPFANDADETLLTL